MNKRQISNRVTDMSLAIPAYNRSAELKELLCSLENQALLPAEIIICEDCSPEREAIRSIANYYRPVFAQRGCCVNYIENSNNLGYDGNVRKLLCEASQKWVMLMGNDDLVLPGCFERAENFIDNNPQVNIISRAFVRFSNDINSPLGVSRLSANDRLFVNGKDKPRMIFRSCGFVGGLIVNTAWARQYDTAKIRWLPVLSNISLCTCFLSRWYWVY